MTESTDVEIDVLLLCKDVQVDGSSTATLIDAGQTDAYWLPPQPVQLVLGAHIIWPAASLETATDVALTLRAPDGSTLASGPPQPFTPQPNPLHDPGEPVRTWLRAPVGFTPIGFGRYEIELRIGTVSRCVTLELAELPS